MTSRGLLQSCRLLEGGEDSNEGHFKNGQLNPPLNQTMTIVLEVLQPFTMPTCNDATSEGSVPTHHTCYESDNVAKAHTFY